MSLEHVDEIHRPSVTIELWSINRWLRYTGLRIVFITDENPLAPDAVPCRVGLAWYGWKGWLYAKDGSK